MSSLAYLLSLQFVHPLLSPAIPQMCLYSRELDQLLNATDAKRAFRYWRDVLHDIQAAQNPIYPRQSCRQTTCRPLALPDLTAMIPAVGSEPYSRSLHVLISQAKQPVAGRRSCTRPLSLAGSIVCFCKGDHHRASRAECLFV